MDPVYKVTVKLLLLLFLRAPITYIKELLGYI